MRKFIFAGTALFLAAHAAAEDADQFYVIDKAPGMIRAIGLNSVDGGPTNTSVIVLDVWKKPQSMLLQTLEFNCKNSTYAVVMKTNGEFTDKKRGKTAKIPMGTQIAEIGNLVCAGSGQLEKDRVINGSITQIVKSIWGH